MSRYSAHRAAAPVAARLHGDDEGGAELPGVRLRMRFPAVRRRRALRAAHLRNARRIHLDDRAARRLVHQGRQLISIATNLLPEGFRTQRRCRTACRHALRRHRAPLPEFAGRRPREVFAEFSAEPVARHRSARSTAPAPTTGRTWRSGQGPVPGHRGHRPHRSAGRSGGSSSSCTGFAPTTAWTRCSPSSAP